MRRRIWCDDGVDSMNGKRRVTRSVMRVKMRIAGRGA
jgi:hypothetical protein